MKSGIISLLARFRMLPRRFMGDRCLSTASALSFTTVLALVPLVMVVFAVLSTFPVFEQWLHNLEEFIYRHLVPAASDVIRQNITQFAAQSGRLTVFGLFFIGGAALSLLATIEDAFNGIWRVKRGRKIVQRVLVYWAVITLGPLLIGASLSMTSYVTSLPFLSVQPVLSGFRTLALAVLPFTFELGAFVLLYVTVPNCTVKLREALLGALLAAILFELIKRGFAVYVLTFSNYEIVYGALASIPIFLIWIYLSWVVILTGAELAALCGSAGLPPKVRRDAPVKAEDWSKSWPS